MKSSLILILVLSCLFWESAIGEEHCDCQELRRAIEDIKTQLENHGNKLVHLTNYERRTDKVFDWYNKNKYSFDQLLESAVPMKEEAAETFTESISSEVTKMAESLRTDISFNVSEQIQTEMDYKFEVLLETLKNETAAVKSSSEQSVKQLWTELDFTRRSINQKVSDMADVVKAQRSVENLTSLLLKNVTQELSQMRTLINIINQTVSETEQRTGLIEVRLFDAFDEFLRGHADEAIWNDDDASLPNKYNSLHEIVRRFFQALLNMDKRIQSTTSPTRDDFYK